MTAVTAASHSKFATRSARLILASAAFGVCLPFFLGTQTLAVQQENSSPSSPPPNLSDLQLSSAARLDLQDALDRREYKRAETILVEEAEHDPKSIRSAKLLVTAAGIFFLDGQYLNAAIAWKKAEAITPLDDRSRFTLAMAYIKLDKRVWARPELEKLVAERPQNPLYLYWLARLDFDGRSYSSAVSGLKRVIELDPKMARAYDTLGLCYDYFGRFDDAVANFNRAIELNRLQAKPSPWPHLDIALSLIALNRLPEAEKNLREAVGYGPQLAQAHFQLGRVLEMQGRYQAALDSLKVAATLAPEYADPHYLLGRIYHRLGDDTQSKTEIARFQELKKAVEAQAAAGSPQPPM